MAKKRNTGLDYGAIRNEKRPDLDTGGYHSFTMSHSIEPAGEEPPPERAKRRPAHSDDTSSNFVPRAMTRWATPATAVIAIVALAIAIWALLRPHAGSAAPPSAEQIADAKGRACAAYSTVRNAVSVQTHADVGDDPVAKQAVAANARLAMAAGGRYLSEHVDPAVPPQLADSLRSLAADLQDITIYALAGLPDDDPGQVGRLHDVEAKSAKIVELCK
jgi:hypothetical protein